MEHLTEGQEGFCENFGIIGILISVTCLIQAFIFMPPHWITYTIILVYLVSITGFILLARKSVRAFPTILAATIFLFLLEALLLVLLTFSLVLLILLLYSIVIVALMLTNEIQKKLQEKKRFEKEEKEKWDGILNQ